MRKILYFISMVIGCVFFVLSGFLIIGFSFIDKAYEVLPIPVVLLMLSILLIVTSKRKIGGVKAKKKPFVNPYIDDCSAYEQGAVPQINYPGFHLLPGETLLFAAPANTFVSKEQVVGYSGGGGGVSVRIAKGLTYRTGSTNRAPIRRDVIKYNSGDYIVTNQRLVFIGLKDSFEIPISKVTSVKAVAKDAFIIFASNKQKNIQVDESQTVYAFATTRQVAECMAETK